MFDLAILGGRAVTGGRAAVRDIYVRGGRIAEVLPAGRRRPARRVIDARGLLVLPGVIDAHSHFRLKLGPGRYTADDFTSGSAAAVCGGVTTYLDYTGQGPGESPVEGLKARIKEAAGRSYADFGFHCMLTGWSRIRNPAAAMAEAVRLGAPTFKMFTAYGTRGLLSGDAEIYQAMEAAAGLGAVICVHAENGPVIDLLTERYAGLRHIRALPLSRPPFTEAEPAARLAALAAAAGAQLYLVHLSTAGAAQAVARARAAGGRVMAETCPQYLALDESKLRGARGYLNSCCPPLRPPEHGRALWEAVSGDAVKVIATDNCTFTSAQKEAWDGDIRLLPMGLPGSQTLLPAVYTFGVRSGRIKPEKLAELLCENPARIMGLAGHKGFILPGWDADFAILDPKAQETVDWRRLRHNTDYSPWQGMKLWGFPKYTVLRGEVAAESGELAAPASFRGRYVRRARPQFI